MKKILKALKQKRKTFEKLLGKADAELRRAPEGSLKIRDYKGRVEYYRRGSGADNKAVYIPVRDKELPRDLAQKSYDEKIQRLLSAKIKSIELFLKSYPATEHTDHACHSGISSPGIL